VKERLAPAHPPGPHHPAAEDELRVQASLIHQLYDSLPAILVNLTVMPLVLGGVLWGRVSTQLLVAWVSLAFVVLVARFTLARLYARRKPPQSEALRWARYFTATSLLSGLTWGLAGWFFFVPGAAAQQVFLFVCIIGLAAGSIIVTSYWLPAYYAYAIPSIGLSVARLFAESRPEYVGLALLMLMYLAIISRVARIQNRSARELIRLRDANLDLVQQVSQERDRVVDINRSLDQRVEDRTRELAAEITERRKVQAQLDHLAHHDPLTGLPNRLRFTQLLSENLQSAWTPSGYRPLALLFIDLDRFKEVNDTLGHSIGDRLLQAVAERLGRSVRAQGPLVRLGGDEFVLIVQSVRSRAELAALAEALVAALSQVFELAGYRIYIGASMGICVCPEDGSDVETLVRNADTAMYEAKQRGRGQYCFYQTSMTESAQAKVHLDQLLRLALDTPELTLHYQPLVDAEGRPAGAEALIRWNNAQLGHVSPAQFIPVAEETGFIVPLGAWVLRQACRQVVQWRGQGLKMARVSVNLSVRQLEHEHILQTVRDALAETGLEPAALELEITESVIMSSENALLRLQELSDLGVTLAIDDFGTGYSSLAYLRQLPVDALKIDRSFVAGIGHNPGDEAIIKAVAGIARNLGLRLVAEGVETDLQREYLISLGVDELQGYLLGRPVPAAEFYRLWARGD
jgi:diguanylate cyclase (GGDEF)-like protein